MKKLAVAFLCLMLVLPFSVYADGTESQGATQTDYQTEQQSEEKPSQPAESQPAESQPTESQPSESQPTESQPSESQPTESQPSESQPSDHTHVWDVSYTVPATCTVEGATGYGCSACGAVSVEILPVAGHKFGTQWTRNASGHWHACSVCDEKGDFGNHYPGPAATEEKAQICLTCGYTLTAKLGHTHKYDTRWTSDETGHWYACSGCDDRKDFKEHSYDGSCDPECNICGFLTSAAHSYSGTWLSDENGHWDVCTICQAKSNPEPHIPGPEAQHCIACNFALTPARQHLHESQGSWVTDADKHWKTCACGEKTDVATHIWDDGEKQEDSTTLYTCEDCGFTRTEGEPATSGSNTLVWIGATIVVLLILAAVVLILLVCTLRRGGKYRK